MSREVLIVQPYVAGYRVAFFDRLREKLAEENVQCTIAAGTPRGDQASRADSAYPAWLRPIEHRTLDIRGRSIDLMVKPNPWRRADAVILGLEGSSLPVYRALLERKTRGLRVGLWGHVRPYVNPGNQLDLWLEHRQMQAADHIFAYTPDGANFATSRGIDVGKITTVMNTVDTSNLEEHLSHIDENQIERFSNEQGIDPLNTICFLGGLDSSKRIEFLAQSLDVLWELDPQVKLLVAGRGSDERLLAKAYERKQAISMGVVDTRGKALALSASQAICMPGRIGLVAVDALVARRPIITTAWPFHAPEADYLVQGTSRIDAPNNPDDFARTVISVLSNTTSNSKEYRESDVSWNYPTIDDMVKNYASGVCNLLS